MDGRRLDILLCAVVGVKNNRDAVCWCDCSDVVGCCDSTRNASLLLAIGNTLSGKVGSTALGDLEDERCLGVACSF